jgi:hypothetical protein
MRLRGLFFCVLSALALGQQPSNETPPATMTKVVVHLQSPDVPEGSFAAQPKTMYRAGTRYCRIEEMPDTEHGIHGLVVINEPDAWLINLLSKTAKYQADPGPTFNCRLPVFVSDRKSATDARDQMTGLEFGREITYFQEKGATSRPGPIFQGKSTKAYTVEIGDSQLLLFTSGTPEKPVAIARQHGNKRDVYWYGTYEEVPFDSKLFTKPDDIKVENAK